MGVEVEMSRRAAHQSKEVRRACQEGHGRKARYSYRGKVSADRDHVLCFECYRSQRDRRRAELLAELPPPRQLSMPFGVTLTQRQAAHRATMLEHLRRSAVARS